MMRRVSFVMAALLLAAVVPATSIAATVPEAWQTKALAIAQRVWHPRCGQLTLTFGDPANYDIERDDPAGMGQREFSAEGWTVIGDCSINVDASAEWLGFPDFCTVVLHEAGHSAGMPDTNGKGIMGIAVPGALDTVLIWSPRPHAPRRESVWAGVDRRCVRRMDGTWSN